MKNFQQMVKQRSLICSCLVTQSRLQMPKAMPTIPEEDAEYEGGAYCELIYKQDRSNRSRMELEDNDNDSMPGPAGGRCDAWTTCTNNDLSLALSISGKDSPMELDM